MRLASSVKRHAFSFASHTESSAHAATTSQRKRSYLRCRSDSGSTRHSSHATQPSTSGAPTFEAGSGLKPERAHLSSSRPDSEPTAYTASSCARVGTLRTSSPLASTSSRVCVPSAMTTATLGGSKSIGMAQAAAITLVRPPDALLTSVVGPWLSSL